MFYLKLYLMLITFFLIKKTLTYLILYLLVIFINNTNLILMSYVIQHFYQPAYEITHNPRLKLLIYCQNVTKLFLFFRFNFTVFYLTFFLAPLPANGLLFYKSYFLKYVNSFDYVFAIKLTGSNITKFHKSLSLFSLRALHIFFLTGHTPLLPVHVQNT